MSKIGFIVTGYYRHDKDKKVWASKCNELKLATYGGTKELAQDRMLKALKIWIDCHAEYGLLRSRLDKLNVRYGFIPPTSTYVIPHTFPIIRPKNWEHKLVGSVR